MSVAIVYEIETEVNIVEEKFKELTSRNDIGIILINQHVCLY